jgi:hypothetical protein
MPQQTAPPCKLNKIVEVKLHLFWLVLWLRWLEAGLSPQSSVFDRRPLYVGFSSSEYFRVLRFFPASIIPAVLHNQSFIYHRLRIILKLTASLNSALLIILNLGSGGGNWSSSRLSGFTSSERDPGSQRTAGWVDRRFGLDALEKRKTCSPVTNRTRIHRLSSP